MKKYLLISSVLYLLTINLNSQTILDAIEGSDTYEHITSTLAPGANPIETTDCSHPEFGEHIDMIFDAELNTSVFRFHIHTTTDNDRCIKFDRQRNEIKSYSESPDNLLGIVGEKVIYKWKFKIDDGFQASSSFTHLHQLNAVGGPDDGMPLITLTARKGNPDKLELRYAAYSSQETLTEFDLTPFKGSWVEVEEIVSFDEAGSYSVTIKKVTDETVLFEYQNNSIRMWKTDAQFIRPKWGIYRSLNNSDDLRDEEVLFANFSIEEVNATSVNELKKIKMDIDVYPNPFTNKISINIPGKEIADSVLVSTLDGKELLSYSKIRITQEIDLSELSKGVYLLKVVAQKDIYIDKIVKK